MSDRPSSSELLAWTLLGLATGLVAGVIGGSWLRPAEAGPGDAPPRPRPRRTITRAPLRVAEAARVVVDRLREEPALAHLALQAIAVGPGVIELHGWVGSRAERARAARIAAAIPGITTLVNSLLVHGEDDFAAPSRDADDQTA